MLVVTTIALVIVGSAAFALLRSRYQLATTLLLFPIGVGLFVFTLTEVLSVFKLIVAPAMWGVIGVVALALAISWRRIGVGAAELAADIRRTGRSVQTEHAALSKSQRWWFWPVVVISVGTLAVTLFLAIWGPPNNADSLGYHLPRVMYWLQYQSVDHFATHDLRHVSISPLAGYGLLWLTALSGGDQLLNLVQWVSYLWISVVAGLVMARLAGSRIGGLLAVALLAATPMAIAEATTTQSDLVGALWVVLAIGFVIERRKTMISRRLYVAGLGGASLLAAATKTTALVSMGVVVLVAALVELMSGGGAQVKSHGTRSLYRALILGLSAFIGAALGLLPQAIRNQITFGSISGETFGLLTERQDLTVVAGNSLRIVIRNLGVPTSLSDHVNMRLPSLFEFLRIPWVDPEAVGYEHLPFISLARNEDYAPRPVQLVLGLLAAIVLLVWRRFSLDARLIAAMGVGMFLATALIWKWNEWGNRFLIQVMFAFTVCLAILLWSFLVSQGRLAAPGRMLVGLFVLGVCVYGLVVSLTIQYRPIMDPSSVLTISRELRYFYVGGQQQAAGLPELLERVSCAQPGDSIGIPTGSPVESYFMWVFLNPESEFRLEAVGVENPTAAYEVSDVDWVLGVDDCLTNQAG